MIKEKTCYVATDPKKEEKEWIQNNGRPEGKVMEYILPDGNKMKVNMGCSSLLTQGFAEEEM